MSHLLLRCLGKALLKNGLKMLASAVPFGPVLFDVAADTWEEYRQARQERGLASNSAADAVLRREVEQLAPLSAAEAARLGEEIAREVAPQLPAEERTALAAYLGQVPAAVRRSLRRTEDPSGKSVPANLRLQRPEDLLRFLPDRMPRFQPGDRPIPGVDRELVELLGSGGFGEVWSARNPNKTSAPLVALKFCLDAEAAKSLRNEAWLLERLEREGHHAGIVALRETYLTADPPCLEYEYVEGGDLSGLIGEWHSFGEALRSAAGRACHIAIGRNGGVRPRFQTRADCASRPETGQYPHPTTEERLGVQGGGLRHRCAGRKAGVAGRQQSSDDDPARYDDGFTRRVFAAVCLAAANRRQGSRSARRCVCPGNYLVSSIDGRFDAGSAERPDLDKEPEPAWRERRAMEVADGVLRERSVRPPRRCERAGSPIEESPRTNAHAAAKTTPRASSASVVAKAGKEIERQRLDREHPWRLAARGLLCGRHLLFRIKNHRRGGSEDSRRTRRQGQERFRHRIGVDPERLFPHGLARRRQ